MMPAPATLLMCVTEGWPESHLETGMTGEISTIGLGLAKNAFQVQGADASRSAAFRKPLRRGQVFRFLASPAGPGGHESLRQFPFPGKQEQLPGMRRAHDTSGHCQTLQQAAQE
jgi:hypothetical protein